MGDENTLRVFDRVKAGRVQIGSHAFDAMLRYRQLDPMDYEAGGMLLGRYILDTDDVVIDRITTPQLGDSGSRYQFFRARKRHQNLIDAAWRNSKTTLTYLGEWHTHPESIPHPSVIDRAGWTQKLMLDDFSESLFFVIIGTEDFGIWEGRLRLPIHKKLCRVRFLEERL
jgi:integrative and conjugative element protein (TIGR02256 family)